MRCVTPSHCFCPYHESGSRRETPVKIWTLSTPGEKCCLDCPGSPVNGYGCVCIWEDLGTCLGTSRALSDSACSHPRMYAPTCLAWNYTDSHPHENTHQNQAELQGRQAGGSGRASGPLQAAGPSKSEACWHGQVCWACRAHNWGASLRKKYKITNTKVLEPFPGPRKKAMKVRGLPLSLHYFPENMSLL